MYCTLCSKEMVNSQRVTSEIAERVEEVKVGMRICKECYQVETGLIT